MKEIIIIGYSGHAYVVIDIFKSKGRKVTGYCESEFKNLNPYRLNFFESEKSDLGIKTLKQNDYFIAIGSNSIRAKIQEYLFTENIHSPVNAIHNSAIISTTAKLGFGVLIAQGTIINALAKIGDGTVCNTGAIIEHEVEIGKYAFIAPGATLLGGVKIGDNCIIGANSVILQNVKIGKNCIIGAGSVILKDIPPNSKVVGNPQRFI